LIGLVGPTASGKTEASVLLAEAMGAEIVCLDSMLVYRGMDVGTAKPTASQRARVRHHLIDLVNPGHPFSVAAYQTLARRALEDVRRRAALPLLVGGSGLYYRAVVDGLSFPATVPGTRRLLETEAAALGAEALHRRLAALDPTAAGRIEPGNVRRTIRALEVAAVTGRPFSSFATSWGRYPEGRLRVAGVDVARPVLYGLIEHRVHRMMPGLLEETAALVAGGAREFLLSARIIGYAEAVAVLDERTDQGEAAERIVRRTKALARHQMGWFRRDPRIRWFAAGQDGAAGILDDLRGFLEGNEVASARAGAKEA
jgi:tRNA dimethylallyltransferase